MKSREIDRTEWRQFTEAFSRQHDGWLVSLYAERRSGEHDYIARDVPFRGIIAETDRGREAVTVMIDGSGDRHLSHTVSHPDRIVLIETDEGAEAAISVTDESGAVLTTEFRTPMPVSVVDGIVKESFHEKKEPSLADSLREWGFDFSRFEAKAKKSMENACGDLSEVTGVLRQTLIKTKQTLVDLQKSREPVAAELKNGFERAWEVIEEGFARARQRMREQRSTGEKHESR